MVIRIINCLKIEVTVSNSKSAGGFISGEKKVMCFNSNKFSSFRDEILGDFEDNNVLNSDEY